MRCGLPPVFQKSSDTTTIFCHAILLFLRAKVLTLLPISQTFEKRWHVWNLLFYFKTPRAQILCFFFASQSPRCKSSSKIRFFSNFVFQFAFKQLKKNKQIAFWASPRDFFGRIINNKKQHHFFGIISCVDFCFEKTLIILFTLLSIKRLFFQNPIELSK